MKIYKYKDLTDEKNLPHFYQIVLQRAIWCARPESLNDEEEFRFKLDYEPSSRTRDLLTNAVSIYRTTNLFPAGLSVSFVLQNKRLKNLAEPIINNIINNARAEIGVACFSAIKNDDYLWNEYGGKGNGVCIEVEIPDEHLNDYFYPVHYVSEKTFHVDAFLESSLFPDKEFDMYRNMLLTKTEKWSREKEIRYISKSSEVNVIVDGRITEITFGSRVPIKTLEQLGTRIAEHCRKNNIRITKFDNQEKRLDNNPL